MPKHLPKILWIENRLTSVQRKAILKDCLMSTYTLLHASDIESAIQSYGNIEVAVVLIDLYPSSQGRLPLIQSIRNYWQTSRVIGVPSRHLEALFLYGLKNGVQDYFPLDHLDAAGLGTALLDGFFGRCALVARPERDHCICITCA